MMPNNGRADNTCGYEVDSNGFHTVLVWVNNGNRGG
jgi:hypothetical protein